MNDDSNYEANMIFLGVPENIIINDNKIQISIEMLVGENKQRIGKSYKVIDKLGEGSYARIYKAQHLPTKQMRVMKLIKKDYVKFQDEGEQKFLKEIQVMSTISHPNIIKFFEYFTDEKYYYLVTELALGGQFYGEIYKIKNFTEVDAAVVMQQILSAVAYLHSKGIVHRDLKPENMMLETSSKGEMNIKLVDFGTAKFYSKTDNNDSKMNLRVGTPYYMAPEVIKKDYTSKCDLWSCGVILYILLSGYPPFDGRDDAEVLKNVYKGKFIFHQKWDLISKEAKDLVTKLLTMNPIERLSAEEALKHPWILNNIKLKDKPKLELPKLGKENLQKFTSKQALQQTTTAYLVHQMTANEEVKKLRNIFKQLDESGDGRLSKDELRKGYQENFCDLFNENEFDKLICRLDQDNSGYVEYEEFLRATMDTRSLLTETNLKQAFAFFDKDNSGKLSADEVRFVLGVSKERGGDGIANKVIVEVDSNGDGEISYEEFKALMKKSIINE